MVSVLDGDTIEVLHNNRTERIPLNGIDNTAMTRPREQVKTICLSPGRILSFSSVSVQIHPGRSQSLSPFTIQHLRVSNSSVLMA